jgi:hypothetical protein
MSAFVTVLDYRCLENLCNCQKLGDEYHYVLECSFLNDKRKQLLPKYFMKRHNVVKFFELEKMLAYAIYLYSHNPIYNGIEKYTNYIYIYIFILIQPNTMVQRKITT